MEKSNGKSRLAEMVPRSKAKLEQLHHTYGGKASPKRPKERVSLIERAGRNRKKDLVLKITERERKERSGEIVSPVPRCKSPLEKQRRKAGLEILSSVTEESNELVRKIERQKRVMEKQNNEMQEITKKLEVARKEMRELYKRAKGARKSNNSQDAYIFRLDSLHVRLNDAIGKERKMRDKINEMRHQQMDDMMLQRELIEEREFILVEKERVLQETKQVREREAEVRAAIKVITDESDKIVADMKEEWHALGVFVDAKTDREKMRLWQEKREQEMKEEEEDKKKLEEAKKAMLHFSPFVSNFEKSQSRKSMVQQASPTSPTQYNHHGSLSVHLKDLDDLSNTALAGNLTVNQEKALKSSIQQSKWQIARGQVALQSLENKASTLEQGFSMIKAKTGIETPAKMVETFLQKEEEIFRLFTHVNLLSEQIEELESSVSVEREEIEKYRGKDGESTSGRSIMKQLDDRLERLSRKTALHEELGRKASNIIDQVKSTIASIFVRIGCDTKLIENFVFQAGSAFGAAEGFDVGLSAASVGKSVFPSGNSATKRSNNNNHEEETKTGKREDDKQHTFESGASASPKSPRTTNMIQRGGNSTQNMRKRLKKGAFFEDPTIDNLEEHDAQEDESVPKLEITEKNLLQYIGVIEQRVSELLMVYNILMKQRPHDPWKDLHRPMKPLPSLPSTEREEDDWSEDEHDPDALRPLSYHELLKRVASSMNEKVGPSYQPFSKANGAGNASQQPQSPQTVASTAPPATSTPGTGANVAASNNAGTSGAAHSESGTGSSSSTSPTSQTSGGNANKEPSEK